MKTVKTVLVTLIILAILAPLAALAFMYSGVYNVAASVPHAAPTLWAIRTTRNHSVALRARDVDVPDLSGPDMIRTGFAHYRENCAACHGAPGVEAEEGRQDMYPSPPDLAESGKEMPANQLFWIIKHGIKMTGMPAWGKSHTDAQIWAMVAFIKQLPNITAADYAQLDSTVSEDEHHHHDEPHHDHAGHMHGGEE